MQRKPACLPGTSRGTLALPSPGRLCALLPQCRADQRHLPIALFVDALQGAHVLLESANHAEEEAAWQWGRNTFKSMQVLLDPVLRILACEKSLVQPVRLGPGSLPRLRAATAGTGSSLRCCAKHARGRLLVLKLLLLRLVSKLRPTSCQLTPRSSKRARLIAVHSSGILIWSPSESRQISGMLLLTRTGPTLEWTVIKVRGFFLFVLCKVENTGS